MPTSTNNPHLPALANQTNNTTGKTSIEVPRKSNERTISGVFTYTSGTDVDATLSDHRLEQRRGLKNNVNQIGLTNASNVTASSTLANGSLKAGNPASIGVARPRSQSKAGSVHSMGSAVERNNEQTGNSTTLSRTAAPSETASRSSYVDSTTDLKGMPTKIGENKEQKLLKPQLHRGLSEGSSRLQSELPNIARASNAESSRLEVPNLHPRTAGSGHRYSSPPAISHLVTSNTDSVARHSISPEPPKLTQRHTLQIPRASGSIARTSRDFSFSAGDEPTTGPLSPTRDYEPGTPRHRRPSLGLVRRTTRSMASDAYPDEVLPDEDAARWTEVIKQKRASRRKRREEEEDDERVVVGKKVEEGHVNWVTAYNMLTGIRFTVSRTNAKMDRELTDADFDARHKFSFDITGNELTPSAKYDFKFKDYSPWVFRHLRAIFGLDPADYLMSLTSKYILSELGSPGKSGSFFYFSRDYKYIIKTIHHAEHKLLRKILRDYYAHVRDNPNTLISQFYGLHRVKIPYGRKIHFVVMNNLFPPHRDIHQTFDLKGSTIGRDFREDDLGANPRATLKDLNWLRRDLHLEFQQQVKKMFLDQIQKDVALLQKLHIMDYSLLVGMHDVEKGNEEKLRETTLQVFQPGGERGEGDDLKGAPLLRTPSRLENARKARELRQTLKKEKPTPMSLVTAKMPEQMKSTDERQFRIFYSDDGGIRATHEDGAAGDMVYYLGIIDCLTHYGFVKRLEHFWKGMSSPRTQISPVPPQNYGDRFINFITGITMTKEEADRRKTMDGDEARQSVDTHQHAPTPIDSPGNTLSPEKRGSTDAENPPRSPAAVERTMKKAQKQVEKTEKDPERPPEEQLPDRQITTVTVPDQSDRVHDGDRAGRNSTTLPVVQEVGEGSSDISSRRSDRAGSESRETEPATTSSGTSKSTHAVKPISFLKGQSQSDEDDLDEKTQWPTPATEYFTPTSPNFSRPIIPQSPNPHNGTATTTQQPSQHREKAPRLDSGLIPHLTPLYPDSSMIDPEKDFTDATEKSSSPTLPSTTAAGLGLGKNTGESE